MTLLKRTVRLLAGWLCIALGAAVTVLLGFGVLEPGGGRAMTPAMVSLLPSIGFGLAIFAVGVWLIATSRSK